MVFKVESAPVYLRGIYIQVKCMYNHMGPGQLNPLVNFSLDCTQEVDLSLSNCSYFKLLFRHGGSMLSYFNCCDSGPVLLICCTREQSFRQDFSKEPTGVKHPSSHIITVGFGHLLIPMSMSLPCLLVNESATVWLAASGRNFGLVSLKWHDFSLPRRLTNIKELD